MPNSLQGSLTCCRSSVQQLAAAASVSVGNSTSTNSSTSVNVLSDDFCVVAFCCCMLLRLARVLLISILLWIYQESI
jgi:hypothetical protein